MLLGTERREDRHPDLPVRAAQAQDEAQAGRDQRGGLQEPPEVRGREVRRDGQAGKDPMPEALKLLLVQYFHLVT